MARHKDVNWSLREPVTVIDAAVLCVLMDIRDELKSVNVKLNCYRIPRALDALHSMGVAARRRKKRAKRV